MLTPTDHSSGVLELHYGEKRLLAYNYLNADVYPEEVPKPYFHPLATLGGSVVTLCRPNDHPWHKGLGMTLTKVGDANFWGGVTYEREHGYHWVANHGRQRHAKWLGQSVSGDDAVFAHEVEWENAAGRILLRERREFRVAVQAGEGYWTLDFLSRLQNQSEAELALGTYEASEGLSGSFYTGLFWRIPREFLDRIHTLQYNTAGKVFCDHFPGDEEKIHGTAGRWVALHGSVDTVVEPVTLAMIDISPPAQSHPRVFLRRNQVGIALPFQGPEELKLAPGEELDLGYRLLIADGHWEASRLEQFCSVALNPSEEGNL